MTSGTDVRMLVLIAAATGLLMVGYLVAYQYGPSPTLEVVTFLLLLAAFPWILLVTLGLTGGWYLAAWWIGLTVNGLFLIGFLRWSSELRGRRRENLARRSGA